MTKKFFVLKGGQPKGFTLVEMILVVGLISIIGLAVYQSLSYGLKIWTRSQKSFGEEDVAIFLEKFSQDLRNSFSYSLIDWKGQENKVSFPTVVRTLADKKKKMGKDVFVPEIGAVEYFFDPVKSAIFVRKANYSQALDKKFMPSAKLVYPVSSMKFLYLYFRDGKTEVEKKISDRGIPAAVQLEVAFPGENGQVKKMSQQINVPEGE